MAVTEEVCIETGFVQEALKRINGLNNDLSKLKELYRANVSMVELLEDRLFGPGEVILAPRPDSPSAPTRPGMSGAVLDGLDGASEIAQELFLIHRDLQEYLGRLTARCVGNMPMPAPAQAREMEAKAVAMAGMAARPR